MSLTPEDIAKNARNPRRFPVANCELCRRVFVKNRPWQRFCGKVCRMDSWIEQHPRVRIADYRKKETA